MSKRRSHKRRRHAKDEPLPTWGAKRVRSFGAALYALGTLASQVATGVGVAMTEPVVVVPQQLKPKTYDDDDAQNIPAPPAAVAVDAAAAAVPADAHAASQEESDPEIGGKNDSCASILSLLGQKASFAKADVRRMTAVQRDAWRNVLVGGQLFVPHVDAGKLDDTRPLHNIDPALLYNCACNMFIRPPGRPMPWPPAPKVDAGIDVKRHRAEFLNILAQAQSMSAELTLSQRTLVADVRALLDSSKEAKIVSEKFLKGKMK